MIVALLSVVACDDDSKKEKPEYEVEIYFSEDVKIVWQKMKAERAFKKPRIHVDHPEGVKVTHDERQPRKKTVFDFAPVALPIMLALFLVAALRCGRSTRSCLTLNSDFASSV